MLPPGKGSDEAVDREDLNPTRIAQARLHTARGSMSHT